MANLCSSVPVFVAIGIAVAGCIVFVFSLVRGISGFFEQLNVFGAIVGPDVESLVRTVLIHLAVVFCITAVLLLILSIFVGTARTPTPEQPRAPLVYRILGGRKAVGIGIIVAHTVFVIWLVVFCACAMISVLYIAFFIASQQFCLLVDNQCFDFRVLIPIVKRFTKNKVDLTFCVEKKEVICTNHRLGDFIVGLIGCVVALLGIVYILMGLSAAYAKLGSRQVIRRGSHYAVTTTTEFEPALVPGKVVS